MTYESVYPLFRLWRDMPRGKPRAALKPELLGPSLIPYVSLGSVLRDGHDIRYDLVAHSLQLIAPRITRGSCATDPLKKDPDDRLVLDHLLTAVRAQRPRAFESETLSLEGMWRKYLIVLFPLGIDCQAPACEDVLIAIWPERITARPANEHLDDVTYSLLAEAEAAA